MGGIKMSSLQLPLGERPPTTSFYLFLKISRNLFCVGCGCFSFCLGGLVCGCIVGSLGGRMIGLLGGWLGGSLSVSRVGLVRLCSLLSSSWLFRFSSASWAARVASLSDCSRL